MQRDAPEENLERLFSPTNQNFHQTRNHFLEG